MSKKLYADLYKLTPGDYILEVDKDKIRDDDCLRLGIINKELRKRGIFVHMLIVEPNILRFVPVMKRKK